jgi:HME family heavy-metal exporter
MDIPEVKYVGRRTGRAELDEHAEGVHTSELDIGLTPSKEWDRSASDILQEIRAKLSVLPVAISIGQPISHRIDHMLSGSRTQIAMLIFGDNLETLRAQAELLKSKLSNIPGIADLEVEKQVLAPQIRVVIDYDRASQYGLSASGVNSMLQGLIEGERITQVIEGSKRFNLIVKLPEGDRSVDKLGNLVVDTPKGYVSLNQIATIEESDGPNQISRDGGKRRILISANASGNALSDVVSEMRKVIDSNPLPEGYFITIGGQFTAQEEASKLIGLLSACALAVIFSLLYSKYRSVRLSAIIMVNIPLAMIGGVFALWLFGQPLSIASMVGFVALAGVSIRNGILKISHYLNLILTEQKPLSVETIIQGSLERLSPVLMTALVTAFALMPLLFEANQPGTEILHPVAVVIFFGLFSSTLLDSFLTPILFLQYGQKDMVRIKREFTQHSESF